MAMNKLSILIPAYNEGNTIHFILDKVKAVELVNGIQKEVIIVNDVSVIQHVCVQTYVIFARCSKAICTKD